MGAPMDAKADRSALDPIGWTSRNRFLFLAAFLATTACRGKDVVGPDHPPPQPPDSSQLNIVLILTDDQRIETLATMPLTKNLIRDQGVEFTNAFASTPLCCPSRASILTGLYAHNHGVLSNYTPMGGAPVFQDQSTIATHLRSAGYRTALIGKYLNYYDQMQPWPYRPPGWSTWRAFVSPQYLSYGLVEDTVVVPYGSAPADYSTEVLAQQAVRFIGSTAQDRPFFLYFAPYAPHPPARPAEADAAKFSNLPPWRPPSFNEPDVSDKPLWVQNRPSFTLQRQTSLDQFRLQQYRSLQAVDRAVGDIINALKQAGRLDRTAIIFAGDNGYLWGEHRLDGKNCLYEECIRVPLIIRAPGVAPRTDRHLVQLMDLTPTMAAWAGVPIPWRINGRDLTPLLANREGSWRTEVLIEVFGSTSPGDPEKPFSAVRTDQYVYSELMTGERELYDLAADPFQEQNIAGDPANGALIATLKALLNVLKRE
jgi:N-acetylglucosamine-6-sulfatase